jgi:hypothetical protein
MKRIVLLVVATIVAAFAVVNAAPAKIDSVVRKEIKIIKTDGDKSQKDSILYSKLSAEQLLELKREEASIEKERIESNGRNDMPLNGFGIVVIVLLPFLFVFLLFLLFSREKNKESVRKHDLYLKSLEMGQTLPENFFEKPVQKSGISNLKSGILWLSVGLGFVLYFLLINEKDALIVGIIPTFVGIGYLLVHFLDKPKNNNEQNG